MAIFKSKTTHNGYGYTLRLELTETVSMGNNSSTIAYSLYLDTKDYRYVDYKTGYTVSLNGSLVKSVSQSSAPQISVQTNSSKLITSGTTTIKHNSDGTKSINVAASLTTAQASYTPGSISLSGTMTLTSIPTKATISVVTDGGNYNIGNHPGVNIIAGKSNTGLTYIISYGGKWSDTITNSDGKNKTYVRNNTTLKAIPYDAISGLSSNASLSVTLTTKKGSTVIGTSTSNTKLNVNLLGKPTLTTISGPLYLDESYTFTIKNTNSYYTYKLVAVINNKEIVLHNGKKWTQVSYTFSSNLYANNTSVSFKLYTYNNGINPLYTTSQTGIKLQLSSSDIDKYEITEIKTLGFENKTSYYLGKANEVINLNGVVTKGSSVDLSKCTFSFSYTFNGTVTNYISRGAVSCNNNSFTVPFTIKKAIDNELKIKVTITSNVDSSSSVSKECSFPDLTYYNYRKFGFYGFTAERADNGIEFKCTAYGTSEQNFSGTIKYKIKETTKEGEQRVSGSLNSNGYYSITKTIGQVLGPNESAILTLSLKGDGEPEPYVQTITLQPEERAINFNFKDRGISIGTQFNDSWKEADKKTWAFYVNNIKMSFNSSEISSLQSMFGN